jgi:hypothetical protein
VKLKVRRYNQPKSSNTARIMRLKSGGSAVLCDFTKSYLANAKRFTGPGLVHPVLVLYDNDDGRRKVPKVTGQFARVDIGPDAPFAYIKYSLYLIPTPKIDGKDSQIEDFFSSDLKQVRIDGKKFNGANKIDVAKEYGKMRFGTRVVEPRADKIDFSTFRPLLQNLAAAMSDYDKRTKAMSRTA